MSASGGGKVCEECGRPSASYTEYLHGAYGDVGKTTDKGWPKGTFPPEGYCGRANQEEDYYDNGQCEDCATYPLKKRIAELEAEIESLKVECMGEDA